MNWTLAGAVILSGIVIVFAILCILILVVNLTGKIAGAGKPPAQKTAAPAPAPPAKPAATAPAAATAPPMNNGIGGETLAVIAAAVAATMEEEAPGVPYVISGMQQSSVQNAPAQRSRQARPVWGFAGMQQNTRPF